MILNYNNTLAVKTLILKVCSVYLFKMIVNLIDSLALKTLIFHLNMKRLSL